MTAIAGQIEPARARSHLWLVREDGSWIGMSTVQEDGSLEEVKGELAARYTMHFRDDDLADWGSTVSVVAAGSHIIETVTPSPGEQEIETFRGTILEVEYDEGVVATAYDELFGAANQDIDVQYPSGLSGASVIRDVLTRLRLPIRSIAGPQAALPRVTHTGKAGALLVKVLQHGLAMGEPGYLLRMRAGMAEVIVPGQNPRVYLLDEDQNATGAREKLSIVDVVDQVVVVGNLKAAASQKRPRVRGHASAATGKKAKPTPVVLATVSAETAESAPANGRTVILKGQQYDTPEAAQKAAEEELAKHGSPVNEREVDALCVDDVHKGDLVGIRARTLDDFYTVESVTKDRAGQTMHLSVLSRGQALYEAAIYEEQKDPVLVGGSAAGSVSGPTAAVSKALTYARAGLGSPYVWGGGRNVSIPLGNPSKVGWDCSGYMMQCYQYAGVTNFGWGNTDTMQDGPEVTAVSAGAARPGDLIFYPGHVAMVSERAGMMYEAASPAIGTVISPIRGGGVYRRVRGAY